MNSNRVRKRRAAALSIGSNGVLIVAKLAAGLATGSIAILTEAIHSLIDLIASVVAYVSVGIADEPPDHGHPYGHRKVENLAAVVEAVLIVVGAVVIVYESIHRLFAGSSVEMLGIGMGVMGLSVAANVAVSTLLYRRAAETNSPALAADAAHLRTDAITSFAVLVALAAVELTGVPELDSLVAIGVAVAISAAAIRILRRASLVLVDTSLPPHELELVRDAITGHGAPEVVGFHKLRARGDSGSRHVDMHVQFAVGTTLERAHSVAHELQDAIRDRLDDVDVLIHLEPADKRDGGGGVDGVARGGENADPAT